MVIQFVDSYYTHGPTVQLFDGVPADSERLYHIMDLLAGGWEQLVLVNQLPGFESADGTLLFFRVNREGSWIRRMDAAQSFECALSQEDWDAMLSMMYPLFNEHRFGIRYSFIWESEIALYVSTTAKPE